MKIDKGIKYDPSQKITFRPETKNKELFDSIIPNEDSIFFLYDKEAQRIKRSLMRYNETFQKGWTIKIQRQKDQDSDKIGFRIFILKYKTTSK